MSNYITQSDMPTSGQFVVVWEYDNKLWSATLKWTKYGLCRYDNKKDTWAPDNYLLQWHKNKQTDVKFFEYIVQDTIT